MSALIELKYFNTFWLKRIKSVADVTPGTTRNYGSHTGATFTIPGQTDLLEMNVGQQVTMPYIDGNGDSQFYSSYIVERLTDFKFEAADELTGTVDTTITPVMTFGKIINFDNIPQSYPDSATNDWVIEESRIRGGYNNTTVDFGVKAYLVDDEPNQLHRFSSLIHSGIFNSRTGVNQTNQFSVAEDITRTIDPANGSIQKLYAEDTNLIIFQESKVSKSLIDKDAIYSAEGNATVTSRPLVIGQNVAYAGEYGISTDPESFAVNGYRKYFTDRDQNVVLRLSMDGITPISSYGMTDFFRDKLSTATGNIIGGWDAHNKQYVLSIPQSEVVAGPEGYKTLAFDETSKGWVSLFDYRPNQIISLNNNYFTTTKGKIYQHYKLAANSQSMATFYGTTYNSTVTLLFNKAPSVVKNFQTINYEGDSGWRMRSFTTNTDNALSISEATFATTLTQMQNSLLINNFKLKEDKYYADLVNATPSQNGEIVFGGSSSGVKGFFGKVKIGINNVNAGKKELFAVSTGFVKSS
tara:strand:- start:835 stop:2406 length:1572 start_codon:yes stop_codon:yes gene_type:complete